ncbi:MAG: hypothetical protein H6621_10295 [Halobacteriovoraceae bacterium]|nr:hypothetical protein [Halobacteriovoraceae bacterium]MCB9095445.1 hypothetical protein [Halobacteriovoraceae bacterium]
MKRLLLSVLILGNVSVFATELKNPTVDGKPFKAYKFDFKNQREASKICMKLNDRGSRAIDYSVNKVSENTLARLFPKAIATISPTYGKKYKVKLMMDRIIVNDSYLAVPDNGEFAILDLMVEQSPLKTSKNVRYFSKIICN